MNEPVNEPAITTAEADIEPAVAPVAAAQGEETSRTHHRGGSRSSRRRSENSSYVPRGKKSHRVMLAIALAISLLLLLVVGVLAGVRIDELTIGNQTANAEAYQAKQALAKAMPELQQARKELANLIKGKFPHLIELAPDKVIKLDAGYVKNIVFTVLQRNGKSLYEYRLVVENASGSMLRPDARIFVFDHRGAQIGMGEISDRSDMVPGESRSYSSTVERFIDAEPRYFYVWTRGK